MDGNWDLEGEILGNSVTDGKLDFEGIVLGKLVAEGSILLLGAADGNASDGSWEIVGSFDRLGEGDGGLDGAPVGSGDGFSVGVGPGVGSGVGAGVGADDTGSHETPFPMKFFLQVHVNEPSVLLQSALFEQLSLPREHSSISLHTTPFPSYPALQKH
mmetsp:Transcript_33676/g.47864  ORF Transcript_33676/g.47864 Transcript_33676/m.47864 type:complete len:158 (-) Transcript_33676:568-1041(-)